MRIVTRKVFILLASFLMLVVSMLGIGYVSASADMGNLSITMKKGASIRLSTQSGIRFCGILTNYDSNADLEYGVVIVPKDYLTKYDIQGDYVTKLDELVEQGEISTYINAPVLPVQADGQWVIQHSIVNIKKGNYDREFFGVAYAFDGSNYLYATPNDNERSVTYVASAVLNELHYDENISAANKTLYESNQTLLENFVTVGVANSTDNFAPVLNGDAQLAAGDFAPLRLENTQDVNLQWVYESENTNVAAVSSKGLVNALSAGTATITAKSSGLYEESFDVTVEGAQYDFGAYIGTGTSRPLWSKPLLDAEGNVQMSESGYAQFEVIEDVEEGNAVALAKLQEYKDAGLTVYMPGLYATTWGTDTFSSRAAKRVLDLCQQVGLKVILTDEWLRSLITSTNFETTYYTDGVYDETKLISKIESMFSLHVNHSAFYGIDLYDEPDVSKADRIGKIYKAIKKAYPDIYVHCNLLPKTEYSAAEREAYYRAFFEAGLDYLMYDEYPMNQYSIGPSYISLLKERAELCKEVGIDMQPVTLTAQWGATRKIDEADLYWLNNMLVGFGVKNVYYYTYYTIGGYDSNGEPYHQDGYAFIDNKDAQTPTYTAMQKIMAKMQLVASTALKYDYSTAAVYKGNYSLTNGTHKHYTTSNVIGTFAKIVDDGVKVDNEAALVTELKDEKGGYMYMLQNVADPDCTCAYNVAQTTTLTFTSDVKTITVFKDGKWEKVTLNGNAYSVTLEAGHAVYIEIPSVKAKVFIDDGASTEINLNDQTERSFNVAERIRLCVNGEDVTDGVIFTLTDNDGVVAYSNGVITALKNGTAKLNVSANINGTIVSCSVNINAQVKSVIWTGYH